ncbi:MAG: GerMN domain-containing protein [Lachnospiraceae bacterium]|nr:GerMN domain-containing protein [Lachnospiraceae bacterium]
MKKKSRLIVILLLLCSLLTACKGEKGEEEKELQIYYLNKEETEVTSLSYLPKESGENKEALVWEILERLSVQPDQVGYRPAINEYQVKDCILRESQVTLNFSKEYENQHFTREVLSRAAIVKTLTQLDFIQLVQFQVEGKNLADSLGEEVGVLSSDSFLDNTGQDMKNYEEITLNLYFASVKGDRLIKVNRTLHYNTNIALEKLVVEQIIAGPLNSKSYISEIYPTVNKDTKIISVSVKDGICYVNLSNPFLTPINNITPDVMLYSLVNSLTELPGIVKVQLAVEGETKAVLGEKYHLTTLFERNVQLLEEGKGM